MHGISLAEEGRRKVDCAVRVYFPGLSVLMDGAHIIRAASKYTGHFLSVALEDGRADRGSLFRSEMVVSRLLSSSRQRIRRVHSTFLQVCRGKIPILSPWEVIRRNAIS